MCCGWQKFTKASSLKGHPLVIVFFFMALVIKTILGKNPLIYGETPGFFWGNTTNTRKAQPVALVHHLAKCYGYAENRVIKESRREKYFLK
jgi:hypothetical protein